LLDKIFLRLLIILCIFFSEDAQGQLTANFKADTTKGCAPLYVRFSDLSTGNPTSWFWDLGNGIISTQKNPATFYFNPGIYNVKLIIKNSSGSDSMIKTQFIDVANEPTVNFSASDTAGCLPLRVQMNDLSTAGSGAIANWEWDLGDGTISNAQNPLHVYSVIGSFTVTLRVKNNNGCTKILSKPLYINVSAGIQIDFNAPITQFCNPPGNVNFTNNSSGAGTLSYLWDFGDGNTSTLVNPTHNYPTPGNYSVKLVTKSSAGCSDSVTKINYVVVNKVVAAFTAPADACVNTGVAFSNTSSPSPTTSSWSFGDGTFSTDANPVKVYASPGTYTVKLVNGTGGCSDSTTKIIVVKPRPSAQFTTAQSPASCIIPATVSFSSTSAGIASYLWNFGDGGTAVVANPSHQYTAYGSYDVSLIVVGTNGCSDTLNKPKNAVIQKPLIDYFFGVPYHGCTPFTANLSAHITTPDSVVTYSWDFGDGSTSSSATPTHTYSTPGSYNVSLSITTLNGCTASYTLTDAVGISTRPVPNFTASPTNACAKDDVHFTDLSTGKITSWIWSFGDNTFSNSQNPGHHYFDTGYFSIRLIVGNGACKDSIYFDKYIHISPPIANFMKGYSCDTALFRRFTDVSNGAQTWLWDFGDGITSQLQHPTHYYAASGIYTVTLKVGNNTCYDQISDTVLVLDGTSDYAVSDTQSCHQTLATFTAANTNPGIIAYTWNFGDGTVFSSSSSTITHVYSASGNYTTSLTTTDALGCDRTYSKITNIKVFGPRALFNSINGTCINLPVTFTDLSVPSINPIAKRIWSYGDGTIDSTSFPFTHNYNTITGAYTTFNVKLLVIDTLGCADSIIKPIIITDPVSSFNVIDTIRCTNSPVHFGNTSQGLDLTYAWDFGDGLTSILDTPAHPYTAEGLYTVALQVKDRFGCIKSSRKSSAVHIVDPRASFTISDSGSTCPPFILRVFNTSSFYSSILWDFGDGGFSSIDSPAHYYNYPGTYTLKLTVFGYGNCSKTISQKILIKGPSGTINYSPYNLCVPGVATFVAHSLNSASFIWDFGDGNTFPTKDSVVTHTYTDAGVYSPKLLLKDSAGCIVPVFDTIGITVVDLKAGIKIFDSLSCDKATIQLQDSSVALFGTINKYDWDFGDGNTSTQINPLHSFSSPGNYAIRLRAATPQGCSDTAFANLKVVASPRTSILGDSVICLNDSARFRGNVLVADTSQLSWFWSFGNGVTSYSQNPPAQQFSSPGSYVINLGVINSSGCINANFKNLIVHPLPPVDAGADSIICMGQSINLQPSGALTYVWQSDPTLSCTSCANPLVVTTKPVNKYFVTGTSSLSCKSTDSVEVKVVQRFTVSVSSTDTLCDGESAKLVATGADNYTWTPTTGLSDASIGNPIATPHVTTTYTVVGRDYRNCFSDTKSIQIVVYPIPAFNIVQDNIFISAGTQITLQTTNSPDITRWRWIPSTGLSCANCPQPFVSPVRNITYRAIVTNEGGCKAEDQVVINILCNNANVFIPNTFSPNNDGVNDVFYPRGKGINSVNAMRVFNRWGALIYQKYKFAINDASAGWDGKFNGQPSPTDVYVYEIEVVCENNQVIPLKGDVTLMR
jgi:gliding motility-associated-like protein